MSDESKTKTVSKVKALANEFKKSGKAGPSKKDAEDFKKKWKAAAAKKVAAQEALAAAQREETSIVLEMVKAAGMASWEIDGVRYIPNSKGSDENGHTAYLRREGFGETVI